MLKWIKDMLTAGSGTSFARCSTAFTILVGSWSVVHVVLKTHALPDGLSLTGLAGWMTAPYAISKATSVFQKDDPQPGTIQSVQASAAEQSFSRQEKLLSILVVVLLVILVLIIVRTR